MRVGWCLLACGETPTYQGRLSHSLTCTGYRLPTEAEWEYAARAGSRGPLYNGTTPPTTDCGQAPGLSAIGWFCGNAEVTYKGCYPDPARPGRCIGPQPVGQKQPNAWGFLDMSGNVYEWLFDGAGGAYPASPRTNPIFQTGSTSRMIRGGGWISESEKLTSLYRTSYPTDQRFFVIGFRPVRTLGP